MHPSLPIPAGSALTAPSGLFELLLLVTFAAHLLVMNVALGGTLLALASPGPDRGAAGDLARRLPTAVAITVNLGVPPLLFASILYGQYLYTAAILSAVPWLSLFLLVMAAYALLYLYQPRATAPGGAGVAAAAALLLLAASLVLVNVSTLAIRPEAWQAYFDRPDGTVLNLGDPTFAPRWLHFVTASLAVGGLFLAWINRKAAGAGDAAALWRVRRGMAWFTRATMAQFVVGAWFLLALPAGVRWRFLGGDWFFTAVLAVGAGLAGASVVQGLKGRVVATAGFAVATVCAMVLARELARRATLAPEFTLESLPVVPQYGPFFMFLGSFVAVAGLVFWIVSAWRAAAGRG